MEFARKLTHEYGLNVPIDVAASVYTETPKLRVLFSRSSFTADAIRSDRNLTVRRERRNFLRNTLGLFAIAVPFMIWIKAAFFSPQAQQPSYVSNPGSPGGARLLANASSIPVGQSISVNDPTYGQFLLIHLDTGQFVAYSSICTHAGCQVYFDPNAKEIACPCHESVFDPYNGAQVLQGPALSPLPEIPIRYDSATGNIYLAS